MLQSVGRSDYCEKSPVTITGPAFVVHGRCFAKELAVGFSTDWNSRTGLIRLARSTSGVTEFVRHSPIILSSFMLHIVLTFADLQLVVEKLFCCMLPNNI